MVEILFSDLLMEIKTVASSFLFTLLNFYLSSSQPPCLESLLGLPFPSGAPHVAAVCLLFAGEARGTDAVLC